MRGSRHARAVEDGGHHGNPDARDDAGGADGSGADPHLDGIHARVDQGLRSLGRGDVAGDQVEVGKRLPEPFGRVDHVLRVAMCAVQHQDVDMCGYQRLGPLDGVLPDAYRRAHSQAAQRVLAGLRVLDRLLDVLDGYKPPQVEVAVDDQQLFAAVPMQDFLG